jgi:hypothetical protein
VEPLARTAAGAGVSPRVELDVALDRAVAPRFVERAAKSASSSWSLEEVSTTSAESLATESLATKNSPQELEPLPLLKVPNRFDRGWAWRVPILPQSLSLLHRL